jgi:predicted pyridoxine 5'-phosphate oxidase superfamily flavin-nucleotide-binding protein
MNFNFDFLFRIRIDHLKNKIKNMFQNVFPPLQSNLMTTRLKPHYQHEGEIYVQKRRHAPSDTHTVVSRMIDDDMPDQHSEFFTHLSYFGISTIDTEGRPWATIIVGSPTTLIYAVSEIQLNVSAVLPKGDPFLSSVVSTMNSSPRYFAGVGVDFSNRRRNKVAGFIATSDVVDNTLNMSLITNENLGNCPKYITVRKLEYHVRHSQIGADHRNTDNISLNEECLDIINQASTIFLATRHTSNASDNTSDLGLNQRGGPPGFVRTYEEDGNTYIVIPDFSGNRFYQSLGNIQSDRVAGVAFPCFTNGDMLHVTGTAENIYDDEAERIMPRVTLITRIKLNGHVWIKEALNLK